MTIFTFRWTEGSFLNDPYKLQSTAICAIIPPNESEADYDEDFICLPWQYLQKSHGGVCTPGYAEKRGDRRDRGRILRRQL